MKLQYVKLIPASLVALLSVLAPPASADQGVKNLPICYDFGCKTQVKIDITEREWQSVAGWFHPRATTAEAERQARQAIRRARRELPRSKIVVTGCSAQIAPEAYHGMAEVDAVVGNREKLSTELFKVNKGTVDVGNIMEEGEIGPELCGQTDNRARAFVQIQMGCNHRCTFCIIPYGRGNSQSVPKDKVIREIKSLVSTGYNEIVLTGVDIASYGCDLSPQTKLGLLGQDILAEVKGLKRLRLSSLDPAELDEALWVALARHERLMPHFDQWQEF